MPRNSTPLPIREGLNPSRVRVPDDVNRVEATAFLWSVISAQRYRDPSDDYDAMLRRFKDRAVVDRHGRVISESDVLTAGTDVWFYRMPAPEIPVPYDITVVYEDADLLIANKPPFLATIPRAQHITETATVRLRRQTGNDELSPAHRLDRLTSGLLLFTKKRELRGAYQRLFADRKVNKTYEAIARFDCAIAGAHWENRIEKTPGEYQARLEAGPTNAITDVGKVSRLGTSEEITLQTRYGVEHPLGTYELKPKTGKTHQLRLHMCAAGVPILGDMAYPVARPAEEEDFGQPLMLKSVGLQFVDPMTGIPRVFRL